MSLPIRTKNISLNGQTLTASGDRYLYVNGFLVKETGSYYPMELNPSGYVTGLVVRPSETGVFVTTGQTGSFVTSNKTGSFVTAGQTGSFVTTSQTGAFITTDRTGVFVTTGQTGQFASSNHNHAHNTLSILQGGTTNEYYHLTSSEYSNLVIGNVVRSIIITGQSLYDNISLTGIGGVAVYTGNSSIIVISGDNNFVRPQNTGSFVTANQTGDFITIGSNLGAGSGIWYNKQDASLRFKSLRGGSGIRITGDNNELVLTVTGIQGGGGSESTTASNLGAGSGIWYDIQGTDLRFRSLKTGVNIDITGSNTELEIALKSDIDINSITSNNGNFDNSFNLYDGASDVNVLSFLVDDHFILTGIGTDAATISFYEGGSRSEYIKNFSQISGKQISGYDIYAVNTLKVAGNSVITTADTGNFYSKSNPSGFLTGIPNIVYTTGDQTISGNKLFANTVQFSGTLKAGALGLTYNTLYIEPGSFVISDTVFGGNIFSLVEGSSCAILSPTSSAIIDIYNNYISGYSFYNENGSPVIAQEHTGDFAAKTNLESTGSNLQSQINTITAWTGNAVTDGENLGTASGLFYQKSANKLQFKSLKGGSGIQISGNDNELTFIVTGIGGGAGGGEINSGINLGVGSGLFYRKNGVNLEFKSLVTGKNIEITGDHNSLGIKTRDNVEFIDVMSANITSNQSVYFYDGPSMVNVLSWQSDEQFLITGNGNGAAIKLYGESVPYIRGFHISADSLSVNGSAAITQNQTSGLNIQNNITGHNIINSRRGYGAGIYTFSHTINPTTSGNIFNIINDRSGAQIFDVMINCSTGGYYVTKKYTVAHQFSGTPHSNLMANTGPYGAHDFNAVFADLSGSGIRLNIQNNSNLTGSFLTTLWMGASPTSVIISEY